MERGDIRPALALVPMTNPAGQGEQRNEQGLGLAIAVDLAVRPHAWPGPPASQSPGASARASLGLVAKTINRTEVRAPGLDPGMTDDMMSLRALLEKSSDADLLRKMVALPLSVLLDRRYDRRLSSALFPPRYFQHATRSEIDFPMSPMSAADRWAVKAPVV